MQVKAILFDMFDTLALIDNNHEFYNHAINRMHKHIITNQGINNITLETFRTAYINTRKELYTIADKNLEEPHFNQRIQKTLKNLGYDIDIKNSIITGATKEFCQEFTDHVKIDENTKPILQKLYNKYKLGIISNFAIPEGVYNLLKTNSIEKLFSIVIVSGEVNKRKPSPEIFQIALKKIGVTAKEAVFVGDTADADIAGAHATGMKAIYIKRRFEQTLEKFTPDIVIEKLTELPIAINNINKELD
ncbi:MAG: HAD family hydrolase [Nitrososphaerota archaeon]|jgi:putative hydrolase of the HAD superfamily|nr:HAD family hydrolase [Nitrososphaerota archaeon]